MIKKIIKLLALETLSQGITGMSSGDVASFKLGDYSVSFRADSELLKSSEQMTGFPELDRWLKRYTCFSTLFLSGTDFAELVSSEYLGEA